MTASFVWTGRALLGEVHVLSSARNSYELGLGRNRVLRGTVSNGREFSEEWLRVLRRRNASNSIQSRLDRFYLSSACLPQASDHLPVHLSDYDEVTLSLRLLEVQQLLHDLRAEGARVRSRIRQLQDGELFLPEIREEQH